MLTNKEKEQIREYTAGYLAFAISFDYKKRVAVRRYVDLLYKKLLGRQYDALLLGYTVPPKKSQGS